ERDARHDRCGPYAAATASAPGSGAGILTAGTDSDRRNIGQCLAGVAAEEHLIFAVGLRAIGGPHMSAGALPTSRWAGLALLVLSSVGAAQTPPLVIAQQGYFFMGGTYFDAQDGRSMSGQMYVEFQIPAARTHPYPIVMFSGGGQSGLNYTGTPDGREGWMQY